MSQQRGAINTRADAAAAAGGPPGEEGAERLWDVPGATCVLRNCQGEENQSW